jgi:hypothetical protein
MAAIATAIYTFRFLSVLGPVFLYVCKEVIKLYFCLNLFFTFLLLFQRGNISFFTVAAQSKAWTVFSRSEAGSWVRIPLKAWMFDVCMHLFCICVVLCLGSGLATSWSLLQGVLLSVKKMITELNKRPGSWMGWKSHWKKNRLGFLGFRTLSIIQHSRRHNVSGTGSVSVLRWGRRNLLFRPLRKS